MPNNDLFPISPVSERERKIIMHDFHESVRVAFQEDDVERMRNLREVETFNLE
jgi:hypothetical protein